jgi:hypothetical protein
MKTYYLFFFLTLVFINACKKPDGKLSGVITYYFNDNYGDKPDVGAEIYIIERDSASISNISMFEVLKSELLLQEAKNRLNRAKGLDNAIRIDTALVRHYETVCDSALQEVFVFERQAKKYVADGTGAYSANLKPGKYYVLIKSSHSTSVNIVEISGQIDVHLVSIESEKESTANTKFSID